LWQIPEKYIKSSAVFNVDKVTTPLLLMQNTNDGICSFSQALEFFTALRRLGKRAWLLEYTVGNHGVSGVAARDFGIRLRQFFDHYLKGIPAPIWMTRGIPAKMRGVDNGFQLDYDISTPGSGLLRY
jgi:dipeptidyl aminopeptidase/acylaminoacyl peptidase